MSNFKYEIHKFVIRLDYVINNFFFFFRENILLFLTLDNKVFYKYYLQFFRIFIILFPVFKKKKLCVPFPLVVSYVLGNMKERVYNLFSKKLRIHKGKVA